MSSRGVRRSRGEEEEESYFISMADMMVGLLFIFIILLLYFALQFQQKSKALSDAGEARTKILRDLKTEIERRDSSVKVEIDTRTGVLRMPAAILFAKSEYRMTTEGERAVGVIAGAMAQVLPCYSFPRRKQGCPDTPHSIDAIFIEGHTDADKMNGWADNMDLSALRATSTFRAMERAVPVLDALRNREKRPILSVSGYGADRPVDTGTSEAAKSRNRRIDLRFLMAAPPPEDLVQMLTGQE
ncbi:OmpA family protein [Sphingobium sp. WCS2017Hpa-17]|uniref:OmpA/MotB family protein n=1 Tax=Sphingobium sp. WCS2017Hpa-17 TaxID=3073638 RepID=UPI00288B44F1|nr:OmpA family protein [Sphingobium sp. WCS2017Hpa-17]